ncbi:MAG TPA: AAA domain-containing protein [Candidatus Acidoferrales bacterium]|jgi:very-short-patch-repair endonuclease|nr:AAA domain-containing protein [Candidatus Acidoferrales bacterium]
MDGLQTPEEIAADAPVADIGRIRMRRLFEFLRALDERKNPIPLQIKDHPWLLPLHELPCHPDVQLFRNGQADGEAICLLKVAKPQLTEAPKPPEDLSGWLTPTWQQWKGPIEFLPTRSFPAPDGTGTVVAFESNGSRVTALSRYRADRVAWQVAEAPARRAHELYERLYTLWGELRRDGESAELVLGNGLLNWRVSGAEIHHPLIVARVQLVFDPDTSMFRVLDTGDPPELYHTLFRKMGNVPGSVQNEIRQSFEREPVHPLGEGSALLEWCRRVARWLDSEGEALDRVPADMLATPRIAETPWLFVRSRALGYGAALDSILHDLGSRADLPPALAEIAGHSVAETERAGSEPGEGVKEQALFCLPANEEQTDIARSISNRAGVVVQGPPGTGKTHTIANLIGHFLAQGKSVLVTSHTSKALRVLRDKVPEQLRPLCVSVLDDDLASRDELKYSVNQIVANLGGTRSEGLREESINSRERRRQIQEELSNLRNELRLALSDEYRPVLVAGEGTPPSDAARVVAASFRTDDWVPSPVELGAPLPLSEPELGELYASNRLPQGDEDELRRWLPPMESILAPDRVAEIVRELQSIAASAPPSAAFWDERFLTRSALEELRKLTNCATSQFVAESWTIQILHDSQEDPSAKPWHRLVSAVGEVTQASLEFRETEMELGPHLAGGDDLETQISTLEQIQAHLQNGGCLEGFLTGMVHRKWTRYLGSVQVNGRKPRSKKEIQVLLDKARLEKRWQGLATRWSRQVTAIGGPDAGRFGPRPESAYRQHAAVIRTCLDWRAVRWVPLEREMAASGVQWSKCLIGIAPVAHSCGEIMRLRDALQQRLQPEIDARIRIVHRDELNSELVRCTEYLDAGSRDEGPTVVVRQLIEALRLLDATGYSSAFDRLRALHAELPHYARRVELLGKLGTAAREWMCAIRDRRAHHGLAALPGNSTSAWRWRQFNDELEHRASRSMPALQEKITAKTQELELETTALIKSAAWWGQHQRMEKRPEAKQALHYWVDALLGSRGTGQRAVRLKADARRLMAKCREAVPVWIMPLARVVENFDPSKTRFDLVIVDEASQADLMGLIPLYMAEKAVVVGDDEQVTPDAVGQNTSDIDGLISSYLEGIPGGRLFDRTYSLYSIAKANFGVPIRLREHFRCAPDIIQFSNALSYNFEIRPLRDASKCTIRPHLISYKVEGLRGEGKCNKVEAEAVTSLIAAMCTLPAYQNTSIGVVSLLGAEQAGLIDRMLRNRIPAQDYVKRRIVCGNALQFQGDERDVMILSMVDSPKGGPLSLRSDGAHNMYKQRYNVAASRARDQMWVVHSLDPQTDLQPEDLRRRLLHHVLHPAELRDRFANAQERVESEFERQVAARLIAAGYKVVPQWRVGAYRIDLVIEGTARRLAVECDGDRYHPPEHLDADIRRQEILQRLGWTFVRLRGGQYFRNPKLTMEPVFEKLAELGIEPLSNDPPGEAQTTDLTDEVIRVASDLRRQWENPTENQENSSEDSGSGRKITDVPDAEIKSAIRKCVRSNPTQDELVQAVWQALGFQHDSEPIKRRIIGVLTDLLLAKQVCRGSDLRFF